MTFSNSWDSKSEGCGDRTERISDRPNFDVSSLYDKFSTLSSRSDQPVAGTANDHLDFGDLAVLYCRDFSGGTQDAQAEDSPSCEGHKEHHRRHSGGKPGHDSSDSDCDGDDVGGVSRGGAGGDANSSSGANPDVPVPSQSPPNDSPLPAPAPAPPIDVPLPAPTPAPAPVDAAAAANATLDSLVHADPGVSQATIDTVENVLHNLPAAEKAAMLKDLPYVQIAAGGAQAGSEAYFDPNTNQMVIYDGTGVEGEATAHEAAHVWDYTAGITSDPALQQIALQDINANPGAISSIASSLVDAPTLSDGVAIGDLFAEAAAGAAGQDQTGMPAYIAQNFPNFYNYVQKEALA
jgi:hypothetical protein